MGYMGYMGYMWILLYYTQSHSLSTKGGLHSLGLQLGSPTLSCGGELWRTGPGRMEALARAIARRTGRQKGQAGGRVSFWGRGSSG